MLTSECRRYKASQVLLNFKARSKRHRFVQYHKYQYNEQLTDNMHPANPENAGCQKVGHDGTSECIYATRQNRLQCLYITNPPPLYRKPILFLP